MSIYTHDFRQLRCAYCLEEMNYAYDLALNLHRLAGSVRPSCDPSLDLDYIFLVASAEELTLWPIMVDFNVDVCHGDLTNDVYTAYTDS